VPVPLLPVTLLTGFLGSGKTTTLNRVLRHPDAAGTAVVVNELGEIGLDQVLIERSSAGAVLLGNGCLCCTVREDLGTTLEDLLVQQARGEIPAFHRVVIETTGLADPAPILHLLMTDPMIGSRYRLGGVVATVDAVNGVSTLDRHPEAVKQAAVADRLLLTKTDLADAAAVRDIEARLANLNPGARRIVVTEDALDPVEVFDTGLYNPKTRTLDVQRWLAAEAHAECAHGPQCDGHAHATRHDHGIESYAVSFDEPIPWEAFSRWLEALTLKRGEDLLRVKGIVNIAERPGSPVVLHGVQRIFHPPVALDAWPTEDHRTRIVFITRNIERKAIEETLRLFLKA
jgi:G3E family GTPase